MGREEQIVDERIKKIEELKKSGINPYSHRFDLEEKRNHSKDIKEKYSKLKVEEKSKSTEVVAGRVMMKRDFGKISFVSLQDLKGTIQLVFQDGETPKKVAELFKKVDSGDIIGVKGNPMKTKTGEVSVLVKELFILTKSVLPLPDKHKGLKDEDEKLRKRYLDIIMNEDVKELFLKKQLFWSTMRNFLIKKGFLEVETPVLENSAGGAAATPFKTHHNALDLEVYLRISMGELWQKKLIVAGYEKTFEIGRQFRNEGMDAEHLQDYSQMEFYYGYASYIEGMKLVEEMYKEVTKAVTGTLKFERNGHKIDLGKKWAIYDFEKTIKEKTGIDIYKSTKAEIQKKLKELSQRDDPKGPKIEFDPKVEKWRTVDILWKSCRKTLSGPGFLTGQPVELAPLAKRRDDDPRKVEQFQVILAGSEVGNGYSELNDPFDQEERFKEQRVLGEKGDTEAMEHDTTFIEALKYGMPPACGFGVSERLFSFLMNRPIRECVAFPLMKPEGDDGK